MGMSSCPVNEILRQVEGILDTFRDADKDCLVVSLRPLKAAYRGPGAVLLACLYANSCGQQKASTGVYVAFSPLLGVRLAGGSDLCPRRSARFGT
jgi:hypothetical protein